MRDDPETRRALAAIFAETHAPGMVAAVVRGDEAVVWGYGLARRGGGRPNGRTLVRLASISKLFTNQTLAALAVEGRMRPNDPLQRWAPPGSLAPPRPGQTPITLVHLATHTSGLPRQSGLAYEADPVRASAARWSWLGRQGAGPPPGRTALYSNIAYDLLADAISRATGRPYEAVLAERVTRPLGLRDTTPAPSAEACARLMDGGEAGPWASCRPTVSNAGSGGLYSTADDMAVWMRHQLGIGAVWADPGLRISQAVWFRRQDLARIDGLDRAGEASGIGLGWIELAPTATHPRLLEKTGGGWGFMTYVAIAPGRRAGVFIAVSAHEMIRMPPIAARVNDLVGRLAG